MISATFYPRDRSVPATSLTGSSPLSTPLSSRRGSTDSGTSWGRIDGQHRLTHRDALILLRTAGVRVVCPATTRGRSRHGPTHFSLEGVRYKAVAEIVRLKEFAYLPITVIGGSEERPRRFTPGRDLRWDGYRLMIESNITVDNYIKHKFKPLGRRGGDHCALYKDSRGNLYCCKGAYWDVIYG